MVAAAVVSSTVDRMDELPEYVFDWVLGVTWRVDANHPLRVPLINGDATHGWSGDIDLDIYRIDTPDGPMWSVWRIVGDGPENQRKVVSSRPGQPLRPDLLRGLARRDTRRGFDPAASTFAGQEKAREQAARELDEAAVQVADLHRFLSKKWCGGLKSAHR